MKPKAQRATTWPPTRSVLLTCVCLISTAALMAQNQPTDAKQQPAPFSEQSRVTFMQPAPTSAQETQRYSLPQSDCTADYWDQYFDAVAAVPQPAPSMRTQSKELIQSMPRVQELPDERVRSMPRIGED